VEVAHALGAQAVAHRTARLALVAAVAKAAMQRERGHVVEHAGQFRRIVDVQAQRAQARRVDDAAAGAGEAQRA
jgi:hypothetical protein